MCASDIIVNINPTNTAEILIIADRHQLKDLKLIVMGKILNKKNKFVTDPQLNIKFMEYPGLMMELLSQ